MDESRVRRIALAEDHVVVRRGLRMLLSRLGEIEVSAEAGSGDEALELALTTRPDLLLLDLNMPGLPAIEVLDELRTRAPEVAVVILTMEQDPALARQALERGARGYVLKKNVEDDLFEAIRKALDGEVFVAEEVRIALEQGPAADAATEVLTGREIEVLKLVALGHTNPEIAELLGISVRTVEGHRAHISQKVDLPTRPDLVRYALEQRII